MSLILSFVISTILYSSTHIEIREIPCNQKVGYRENRYQVTVYQWNESDLLSSDDEMDTDNDQEKCS